jgi:hypothetical protein
MTLAEIFATLDSFDVQVTVYRDNYRYANAEERWSCLLHLENDGASIKVRKTAPVWDQAVYAAFDSFNGIMSTKEVSKALNLPLLAAPESV